MPSRADSFRWYAWGVVAFVLLVILWGALVRATGSGAGCGGNWPLCNGVVIPASPQTATLIEYTHRVTSGLLLVAVAGLCLWAFRLFPRGHRTRHLAVLSALFLVLEALLGAGLVLFNYVTPDASLGRVLYLSAHFLNTQVLLGLLTLTALSPGWEPPPRHSRLRMATLPVALVVGVSGVAAALGHLTLHPAVAAVGGLFILHAAARRSRRVAVLVVVQFGAGIANLLLHAPVWMQVGHLLVADLIWISLVMLVASGE